MSGSTCRAPKIIETCKPHHDKSVGTHSDGSFRLRPTLPILLSGLARSGKEPPKGFMASTAWKVLSEYYQSLKSKMDTN